MAGTTLSRAIVLVQLFPFWLQLCKKTQWPSPLEINCHPIRPRLSTNQSHARLAQSVERETLMSTRSQGCGFDPRIGLFL
ncbi:hypothetical protein HZ326_2893 [Fusarium oxysporum f. sp. albedinis]|nr:hypothetical protein HZ326_2893 [Fusarium oxysporum f. sp. albedinis]